MKGRRTRHAPPVPLKPAPARPRRRHGQAAADAAAAALALPSSPPASSLPASTSRPPSSLFRGTPESGFSEGPSSQGSARASASSSIRAGVPRSNAKHSLTNDTSSVRGWGGGNSDDFDFDSNSNSNSDEEDEDEDGNSDNSDNSDKAKFSPAATLHSYLQTPTSGQHSPPPNWEADLPQDQMTLTFGIELEYVFAFRKDPGHEHAWMRVDDEEDEDDENVEKKTGSLPPTTASRSPSFKQGNSETHSPDWLLDWRNVTSTHQPTFQVKDLRTLHVQQNILRHAGLACNVDQDDLSTWCLKKDSSIREPHDKKLWPQALPVRIRQGEQNLWQLQGHELVSRVLTAPDKLTFTTLQSSSELQEINDYVSAMIGSASDPFGVFTNASCGFHVHVAREPPSDGSSEMLPLPALQHLAYLLVQFEELITALHPIERRCTTKTMGLDADGNDTGKTPPSMIGSNLMGLQRSPHICQALTAADLHKAATKIFSAKMTPIRLAQLMCTTYLDWPAPQHVPRRYKFVNFERLFAYQSPVETRVPLTIEFRQHAATLDFTEIAHWVHFVLSLVRAAERMALRSQPASPNSPKSPATLAKQLAFHLEMPFPRQQSNKYKIRCRKLRDEYDRLFDLLDFDHHTRQYWTERFARLNPDYVRKVEVDEYGVDRIVVSEEQCPACQLARNSVMSAVDNNVAIGEVDSSQG